jgi:HD-GYP domain-containing protein (c-di-GMP phosphodiesterase class II)
MLTRNGRVIQSNLKGADKAQLEAALASCTDGPECQLNLHGETYLSLAMSGLNFGDGYVLRSVQSVDAASGHVQTILRNVFMLSGFIALMAAFLIALYSSRSVVQPLGEVVAQLRVSALTGDLPEFRIHSKPVQEIRELTDSFNRAAGVIRESQSNLRTAYFEFIGSLANALDARDRYTAGHSRRVSERAVAVANAMKLDPKEIEDISFGALLHDIGKIGVSDSVLQKPGRLTDEEYDLIKQHPTIGRRILEGVHGFQPFLPIVELHHENWDGTGYPLALSGKTVPVSARIVHVVDAYDAMTSDRPYRRGMSHEEAMEVLARFAGSQFDPEVVNVFAELEETKQLRPQTPPEFDAAQLDRLAAALGAESAVPAARSI